MEYKIEEVAVRFGVNRKTGEVMDDETITVYSLEKAEGNEEVAIVPDGVQMIAQDAFSHCKYLRAIDLPDSVILLDEGWFNLPRYRLPEIIQFMEGFHFRFEDIPSIEGYQPELRMRLLVGGYVLIPRDRFCTFDGDKAATFDALIQEFKRVSNREEKKRIAQSVMQNQNIPKRTKKPFAKYLGIDLSEEPILLDESKKILFNAVVKGKKEAIDALSSALQVTPKIKGKTVITAYYDDLNIPFTKIGELPFFGIPSIKCVLFVEETKQDGDNVALYKQYGSKNVNNLIGICDNSRFYAEELECVNRPFLDKDWKYTYTDLSTGEEGTLIYHFEDKKNWSDDSVFQ